MLLTSTTFIRPKATAAVITSTVRVFHKPIRICTRRFDFPTSFSSQKSDLSIIKCSGRSQSNMIDSITISTSKEGIEGFERENFVQVSAYLQAGGIEATLNDFSKWFVSIYFMALILWRHDAETLWAVMGVALNTILSVVLKIILKQERPTPTLRPDPGMPSSHAQSIFYAVAFIILSIVERYGINALTTTFCGLIFILGSYLSWLRVSQQFHTVSQVVVGAVLGLVFSILWHWSWNTFVLKAFMSYLSVRILVVLGSLGLIVGFLIHACYSWILLEQ